VSTPCERRENRANIVGVFERRLHLVQDDRLWSLFWSSHIPSLNSIAGKTAVMALEHGSLQQSGPGPHE
jgi:hypothetical protein